MKKRRSSSEPAVPVGSVFAPVVEAARGMIGVLSRTFDDPDEETRNMRLERIAGMESVLLLCTRAAAGLPLDPDSAVMGPLASAIRTPPPEAPPARPLSLEERMSRLERLVAAPRFDAPIPAELPESVVRTRIRAMPAILERPAIEGAPLKRVVTAPPRPAAKSKAAVDGDDEPLGPCERAFLAALAQRQGQATTNGQLLLLTKYRNSGSTIAAFARLRREGLIEGGGSDNRITAAGLAEVGPFEPLPSGEALIRYWIGELGADAATGRILEAVCDVYPDGLTKAQLLERTGYRWSGSVIKALSTLRKLKFVNKGWPMRAAEMFFEGGG